MPLVSCFSPPDIFTFTPSPPPTEKTSGPTWKLATMPIPIHPTNPRTNDTKLKTGVLKWLAWFCFSTILYLVYIVAAPEKEGHLDEFLFDFLEWKTQREFCIAFSKFVLFNFLIAIGSISLSTLTEDHVIFNKLICGVFLFGLLWFIIIIKFEFARSPCALCHWLAYPHFPKEHLSTKALT